MIAHLLHCAKVLDPARYACNCGAAWQNDLAAKLDALPPIDPLDALPPADRARVDEIAWAEGQAKYLESGGSKPAAQGARDAAVAREVAAYHARQATPPVDTPLRAVARMLMRMRDRAAHHDAAKHLLTTAYAAADLAATLSPEEAIRVLDAVEPAEDDASSSTH